MKIVKLLDTSGKNIVDTIKVTNDNGNTITNQSKRKRKSNYNYNHYRKYYLANKNKLLDYSHRYYRENREKILEQRRAHNALPQIKEKRARYAKQYYIRSKKKNKNWILFAQC